MTLAPNHFAALFRRAPGPVVVFDASFAIIAANDHFFRATGVTRDVIGRNVFDVFPENPGEGGSSGSASFRASLERVVATGEPDRMPITRYDIPRAPDGGGGFEERHWSPSSYPVLGEEGRVEFIVHETEDVTELVSLSRRDAGHAEELAEAKGVYEAIYDQGLFAGRLDLDGAVVDANRSSLEHCGFTREEVIGKPFWECGWWNRSPEIQAWVKGAVERARGGEPFRGVSTYFVADGSERVVEFACMPIKDEAGRVLFLLPTGIDITERVRTERGQRATAILESITDAFFALDREWRFTYLNPQAEAQLQRRRGELVGKVLWEEFPAALGTRFEHEYRAAMEGRRPVTFEEHYPAPLDRWYEANAYPTEEGLAVYFRNVTERRRAEEALADARRGTEQQARYFDATLSAVRDFVFAFDRDFRVRYANRALLELWQVPAEGAIGKTMEELGYPEATREQVAAHIRHVLETGRPVSAEVPYQDRAGVSGYYDYTLAPVFDAGGKVVEVVGSARDTTERRAAEDAVRRSEERFRALVTATSDVVYGMSPDWSQLYPLDGRGLIASNDEPIRNWLEKNLPASEHGRVLDAIERAVSGKATFELEHRVVRPDGTPGWTFSRAVPILDDRGEVLEWFGTASDVTARKRTEEELRSSEERLRFLDALGEATRSASDPFEIMATTARLLGEHLRVTRSAYASVDEDCDRFVIHSDWTAPGASSTAGVYSLDLFGPRAAADMRGGRTLVIRDVDGELAATGGADMFNAIGIKAIVCCPLVKEGRLAAMMAVHSDAPRAWTGAEVSLVEQVVERSWAHIERVRAAEALRENDRRKDEFLAMLAHELRNPLSAIGNAVQVIRRSEAKEHLEWAKDVVSKHVGSLSRMIDDLLDVSRITRGKIELKKQLVEILPVLTNAVETVRPLVQERGHDLTVSHSSEPMWVEADVHRLEQVVVNLLTNAAKYTDSGGTITLLARPDGGSVAITVTDNGTGIPPEKIPQMFELFAQGDRSIARSEGGLGIGLTLVKNLAEMHGGSVTARSEGIGRGSEFTVRLPAVAPPRPIREPRRKSTPGGAAQGVRVLVVDDNVDSAKGIGRLLRVLGHDVEIALDGPSAIEAALTHRPEFVLLDIGLPGMDGYEVARRLRAEGFSDLTIIAVSGYGEEAARSRAKEAGFDHHLVKPVDYERLVAIMQREH